jgi:hypothetical protein
VSGRSGHRAIDVQNDEDPHLKKHTWQCRAYLDDFAEHSQWHISVAGVKFVRRLVEAKRPYCLRVLVVGQIRFEGALQARCTKQDPKLLTLLLQLFN